MRILPLYPLALALMFAHARFRNRERRALAMMAQALACACPLCAAWAGMDFSPSFTMMFLFANLLLCALAEWAWLAGREVSAQRSRLGRILIALHGALFALGTLFSLPSVYIYAAGDDLLDLCVRASILAGALLATGVALARHRKRLPLRLPALALLWFSLSAACFALSCGLRSPALLPYGAGLALMSAANLCEQRPLPRAALFCLGLCSASVFAAAPML